MNLRQSERKQAKIRMALQGSAGSGKTYSSLLLAKGLTGDFSKVAVIDTENGSADLYAHLGGYGVITLTPPFTPQKYVEAITLCEKAGIEVIIMDSISHCWDYLLDYHSSLAGNSFTNWAKIKPLEKIFLEKILHSPCHIIATMRTKQDYVLNQKDGKMVPEKVGLKSVQRDGLDYEFTLVFDVDIKHFAVSSKDRTGLFMGQPEFIISEETGKMILDWCKSGSHSSLHEGKGGNKSLPAVQPEEAFEFSLQEDKRSVLSENASEKEVYEAIQCCNTVPELVALYKQFPRYQQTLRVDFDAKKSLIKHLSNPDNFSNNGKSRIQ